MIPSATRRLAPMYTIRKSIDIDFAHHIQGHRGACINIHGHTWKSELEVSASELDVEGFVVDFKKLKTDVLGPCHTLLDHSLALSEDLYVKVEPQWIETGKVLLGTRQAVHGSDYVSAAPIIAELPGARNVFPGGLKVALFGFSPTSERLAQWLYRFASERLDTPRVKITCARIYETLHPVESVAEYRP